MSAAASTPSMRTVSKNGASDTWCGVQGLGLTARTREIERETERWCVCVCMRAREGADLDAGALEASRERLGEAVHALGDLLEPDGAVVHPVHRRAVGQQRLFYRSGLKEFSRLLPGKLLKPVASFSL